MKTKRRRRVPKLSRRVCQTRRVQSRPGSTAVRKKWPCLLAKATQKYQGRIALSLDPDILHVMWRDEPISRLLLSETRIRALRSEVERRMRATGLIG